MSEEENIEKSDQISGSAIKRWLPVGVLLTGMAAFFVFDLGQYLNFELLREHRFSLLEQVAEYGLLAAVAYIALYIVVVSFSLPGGAVMTVSGGFLFGAVSGTIYSVLGATIGAILLFLIARTSLGAALKEKAGPWLFKMQDGFNKNAMSYLLVLRLIPIFPFWLVNLAPAFLGVSLRTYAVATLIGIIPGTLVFSLIGAGLGSVFDAGEAFTLQGVLTPEIIGALVGLAVLSLIPVIYKRFKKSRIEGEEA
ncbi:TVP38/TMEM64 family protein [Pseudomonadota bacterium]